MQDELDATREDLDTVSVALRTVLSDQASYKKPTAPTTVTVPTASLSTVGSALTPGTQQVQGLEQLTAALIAALQSSNGSQCKREPTRQRQPPKQGNATDTPPWRQWQQYCWSCGVQLSHNSETCKHPRAGHISTATYDNQQGGNARRNHLWEKWCGPDIGIYMNKGDNEVWDKKETPT